MYASFCILHNLHTVLQIFYETRLYMLKVYMKSHGPFKFYSAIFKCRISIQMEVL